jgi:excinuclease ABC subunit A
MPNLERRWKETDSAPGCARRSSATSPRAPCEACHGFRLKPEALAVKIAGQHIGEVDRAVDPQGARLVRGAAAQLTPSRTRSPAHPEGDQRPPGLPERCRPRLPDAVARLRHAVGRREPAHPPGLADRLGLTGVLYVLDEPSIGLHQRDNARLLETLKRLRDLGNTVLVVEHDEDAIRPPTTWSTWAPAPASMAAGHRAGHADRSWPTRSPHRQVSLRRREIPCPAKRRARKKGKLHRSSARAATT